MLKNIKILVSTFKTDMDSVGDFIVPILSGAELYKGKFNTPFKDNTGDNISYKNKSYCELTAQYWAWKNLDCDIYGLMHHRRYFNFQRAYSANTKKYPKPYRIFNVPDKKTLEKIGSDYNIISELTDKYSILAPLRENIFESVKHQYIENGGYKFDDLELVTKIIAEKYPEYLSATEEYFNSHYAYFCNMFIMDRKNFNEYSRWLFEILEEFERRKPKVFSMPRECGKIGERLFGVYMTYIIKNTDIKWAELPRVHFCGLGGATKNPSFNKKFYFLFPPGSRRRFLLRRIKQSKSGR